MALTKVTGHVIKSDTNIISHNINSSGIITAVTFDGNVSGVAVTFTGDSTIASLGITTNLNVGGISTFTGNIDANGDIDVDGHTNLDNVSIAGVTTTTGNITIDGLHSGGSPRMLNIGSGNNILRIYENSSQAPQIYTQGNLVLTGATTEIRSKSGSNQLEASFHATNGVKLYHNNNEKLFVNDSGVNITGILTVSGNMNVEGVLTYQDVTNIDSIGIVTARSDIRGGRNLSVVGISTFTGDVKVGSGITFHSTNSRISLPDGTTGSPYTGNLELGNNRDFTIVHDSNHTYMTNRTGNFYIGISDSVFPIRLKSNNTAEIYHGSTKVFETASSGVLLPDMSTNTGRLAFGDFGTRIEGGAGGGADDGIHFMTNSVARWQMNPDGDLIPNTAGAVDIGSATAEIGDVFLADDKSVQLGNSQDLKIFHDSTANNNVIEGHTASLNLRNYNVNCTDIILSARRNIILQTNLNETGLQCIVNGATELFYDGGATPKLRTTATGIEALGEVAATQDYPTTRPTLDFNFAAEKKLDPRITFYRTTIGSYIDENGDYRWASANQPKFNHDEVTHESKGLLIEPARTNKLSSGNNIPSGGNSGGTPGPSLVANNVEAPDGSFTARTVDYSNAVSNMNSANIEFSWDNSPAGKTYSASIWVKGTQGHTINMYLDASGQGSGNLNEAKITRTLTGKWQRMSVYYTYPSGANAAFLRVGTRSLHGLTQGTATVVSFWGTTVVEESQPGSTIATPIVTVTTAPDYALIDGEDFTEFFNQVEGTIITSTQTLDPAGVRRPAVIEGDVTNNDRHYLQEASQYQYQIRDGGSTQAQIDAGQMTLSKNIIAAAYKLNDAAVSFNGSDAATDTSATMPTCTKLKLGEWSGTFYFGHISRFMYYRNRISNSQLKTISSQ